MKDLIIERAMYERYDGSRECAYKIFRDKEQIYNGDFKGLIELLTILDEERREPARYKDKKEHE